MSDKSSDDSPANSPATPSTPADNAGRYSDHEWETATERIETVRQRMLAENPAAAATEARTYAAIGARVQTLRAIRQARGLTQSQISAELEISQAEVSRMERRTNVQLATLARFIEAVGGQLRVTAVFDDHEVEIGVGDLVPVGD